MKTITTLLISTLLASTMVVAEEKPNTQTSEKQGPSQHIQSLNINKANQADSLLMKQLLTPLSSQKTRDVARQSKGQHHDFWIYDASVHLYDDYDYDGYFSRLVVNFDADTHYDDELVYARLYLGTGNLFTEYHVTSDFYIDDDDSDDWFEVDTLLLDGFYPGDYNVLIELYDAYSHELLASYDDYDDADLSYLPMESKDHDSYHGDNGHGQSTVTHEHSGGSSGMVLLLLSAVIGWRIKRTL